VGWVTSPQRLEANFLFLSQKIHPDAFAFSHWLCVHLQKRNVPTCCHQPPYTLQSFRTAWPRPPPSQGQHQITAFRRISIWVYASSHFGAWIWMNVKSTEGLAIPPKKDRLADRGPRSSLPPLNIIMVGTRLSVHEPLGANQVQTTALLIQNHSVIWRPHLQNWEQNEVPYEGSSLGSFQTRMEAGDQNVAEASHKVCWARETQQMN
jgi:hypothetical protein